MQNAEFLSGESLARLGFASLGNNVLIHATSVLVGCHRMWLRSNIRIDPFCILSAGDKLTIGSNVHIAGHCLLTGSEEIEICDFAGISHGAKILSAADDFARGHLSGPTIPLKFRNVFGEKVRVGRHAIVGANSVVLPGSNIGDGATIGALSLVKGAIDEWTIHAGVPSRLIGKREREGVLAKEIDYVAEHCSNNGRRG